MGRAGRGAAEIKHKSDRRPMVGASYRFGNVVGIRTPRSTKAS